MHVWDGERCGRGVGAGREARGAFEAFRGPRGRIAGVAGRSPTAEGAGGRIGRRVRTTGAGGRTPPDVRRPARSLLGGWGPERQRDRDHRSGRLDEDVARAVIPYLEARGG